MLENSGDSLGEKIRSARERLKMTRKQLFEATAIPVRTLESIEWGKQEPSFDKVVTIAKVLEIKPSELFGYNRKISKAAIAGPLTARDGALILAALETLSPGHRALALGLIFSDPTLMRGFSISPDVVRTLQSLTRDAAVL